VVAPTAFPASLSPFVRPAIVIELIGDLDRMAARSITEAAGRLAPDEGERIVLDLQRTNMSDHGGVAALLRGLTELRRRCIDVDVVAASKRSRTALAAARIRARALLPGDRDARRRHVMIVRNADPERECA